MSLIIREIKESEAYCASEIEKNNLETAWSEAQIKKLPGGAIYFVAIFNEAIIGIASMYTVLDEGQIMNIAVDKKYRGNGFGGELLDYLIGYAEEKGLSIITLEVAVGNEPAIALYKGRGFNEIAKRKGFYRGEDALILEKTIGEVIK